MYNTLRDYRFNKDVDDIRGSAVHGPDREQLGKIDDVVFDSDTGQIRYLVIDTGGWLKTRRFLIPPEEVHFSAEQEQDFIINLTKAQIERFPALDEEVLQSGEKFTQYDQSYRATCTPSPPLSTRAEIPSLSPFSPRFLKFQDEIVRNRAGICDRPVASESRPESRRKVG